MEDKRFLDWIVRPKISGDRIEAEKIHNGKSWVENAKVMRDAEWSAMLEGMEPRTLWPKGTPGFAAENGQREPSICVYPQQRGGDPRGALIICAGGGFLFKSVWEAEPVARRFYEAGLATFILDYRVQPCGIEHSLMDLTRAIRYVRCHAAALNVKPDKIAVAGGSAGGQIAALAATLFDSGVPDADDPVERVSSRPDAAILSYAVTSASHAVTPVGTPFSFGEQSRQCAYSADKHLRPDCPPFFVWQTAADDPRHACRFGTALADMGIPFELHIFPEAPHGCGLADGGHRFAPYFRSTVRWSGMAAEFLENLGF